LPVDYVIFFTYYSSSKLDRQFLAALAYQDKDTLNGLFAPNIMCVFDCAGKIFADHSSIAAINFLLDERKRWTQPRIDIKGWHYEGSQIIVKFHVQFGEDIFTEYLEYVAKITVKLNVIKKLQMYCSEKQSNGKPYILDHSNASSEIRSSPQRNH